MAGSIFSASSIGTFTHTDSPLESVLITRTCSQRSPSGAVCADAANGESTRPAAIIRPADLKDFQESRSIKVFIVKILLQRLPTGDVTLRCKGARQAAGV